MGVDPKEEIIISTAVRTLRNRVLKTTFKISPLGKVKQPCIKLQIKNVLQVASKMPLNWVKWLGEKKKRSTEAGHLSSDIAFVCGYLVQKTDNRKAYWKPIKFFKQLYS